MTHSLPVPVRQIAADLQISRRMVYYSLDRITYLLKSQGIHMNLGQRKGVWIEDIDKAREILQGSFLSKDEAGWKTLEAEERVQKIIIVMLQNALQQNQKFITTDDLCCILDVSRSTVMKDISAAKAWFHAREIAMVSKPRCGILLTGEERAIRETIINFLAERMDIAKVYAEQSVEKRRIAGFRRGSLAALDFWEYLMHLQPIAAYRAFSDACASKLQVVYSDQAIALQILYLAVSKRRLEMGYSVTVPEAEKKKITRLWEFHALQGELLRAEPIWKMEIPRDELYALAKIFLCSDTIRQLLLVNGDEPQDGFERMAHRFIQVVSDRLRQPLTSDRRLLNSITNQFRILSLSPPPAFRQHSWSQLIREQYPQVCRVTEEALSVLPASIVREIGKEDIGYLACHICGGLERCRLKREHRYRAVIVSNEGFGSTSLLRARIEVEFPHVTMIGSWGERELTSIDLLGIDVIFSTVELPEISLIPWVRVSPLLGQEDIRRIQSVLFQLSAAEGGSSFSGAGREMLSTMFSESRISFASRALTKEQAIRQAGELLLAEQYILPPYIDAMVDAAQNYGDYTVLAPGIAMPHARPNAGAQKTGFSVLRLKNPICFGKASESQAQMVFAFSAVDEISHLVALKHFSRLLSSRSGISLLLQAQTPSELYQRIQQCFSELVL